MAATTTGAGVRHHRTSPRARAELTRQDVDAVISSLRSWTLQKADPRSWWLLRGQLALFVLGAGLLAAVPVWNYLR